MLHINISSLIEKKVGVAELERSDWSEHVAAKPFSIHTCAVSHGQLGYLVLISPVVFSLVSSPLGTKVRSRRRGRDASPKNQQQYDLTPPPLWSVSMLIVTIEFFLFVGLVSSDHHEFQ